jgi:hypothetical protein
MSDIFSEFFNKISGSITISSDNDVRVVIKSDSLKKEIKLSKTRKSTKLKLKTIKHGKSIPSKTK